MSPFFPTVAPFTPLQPRSVRQSPPQSIFRGLRQSVRKGDVERNEEVASPRWVLGERQTFPGDSLHRVGLDRGLDELQGDGITGIQHRHLHPGATERLQREQKSRVAMTNDRCVIRGGEVSCGTCLIDHAIAADRLMSQYVQDSPEPTTYAIAQAAKKVRKRQTQGTTRLLSSLAPKYSSVASPNPKYFLTLTLVGIPPSPHLVDSPFLCPSLRREKDGKIHCFWHSASQPRASL